MSLKSGIEAVLFTVGEPSTEEALGSLRNQTGVQFDYIQVIKDMRPLSLAESVAVKEAQYDKLVLSAADIVLEDWALRFMVENVKQVPDFYSQVYSCRFSLWDDFLNKALCCLRVFNTAWLKKVGFRNVLCDDTDASNRARVKGLREVKFTRPKGCPAVGVHFPSPTEHQIFTRFFIAGAKRDERPRMYDKDSRAIREQLAATGDKRYAFALAALQIGAKVGYQHSHDFQVDHDLYDEWISRVQDRAKRIIKGGM